MRHTLNFSTCPNDTFMFGALVESRIDTLGYNFDVTLADIEELNSMAQNAYPDITKVSFGAYPFLHKNYQLLNVGSALGNGVGPLVVSKRSIYPDEVPYAKIALPGERTTAHLLFNLAFPNASNKNFYLFSQILNAVLDNEADVGVIIHETRFTYENFGLKKIMDLGDFWEQQTHLPTPLGGIAVKRDLPDSVKHQISRLIYASIKFAFNNPAQVMPYVSSYAQEMDQDVMAKHIQLYVNDFSLDLGPKGRTAVINLLRASGQFTQDFDERNFFIY